MLHPLLARLLESKALYFGLLMMALWYFWLDKSRASSEVRSRVPMTILGALVALVIGRLLAEALPFRERPLSVLATDLPGFFDPNSSLRTWSSFPSDHAAIGFALSMGLWMMGRWLGAVAFAL